MQQARAFVLGALSVLALVTLYAVAQDTKTAETTFNLIPVTVTTRSTATVSGSNVSEVRLNNGVVCYTLTSATDYTSIQPGQNATGLGCVKQ